MATVPATGDTAFFRIVSMVGQPSPTARYRVQFDATWSSQTHPMNFPAAPHFSGLIGATHDRSVVYWAAGMNASPGIELMAETGGKSLLEGEINSSIAVGHSVSLLSGSGIGVSPGNVTLEFEITREHPLVTLVSMIAPSPDWFVGVHGLNLLRGNQWVEDISVELMAYDAGTDDGTDYVSSDHDTQPRDPITAITGAPFLNNGSVRPVGTFRFTRINP
jgi:hypothetical protein